MTDRKIKLNTHPNIDLTVTVTEQMVGDYKDCASRGTSALEDLKICETCSWWKMEVEHTGVCTFKEMEILLHE